MLVPDSNILYLDELLEVLISTPRNSINKYDLYRFSSILYRHRYKYSLQSFPTIYFLYKS